MKKKPSLVTLVYLIFFMGLIIYGLADHLIETLKTEDYLTAKGRILHKEIVEVQRKSKTNVVDNQQRFDTSKEWILKVSYEYFVGGERLTGNIIGKHIGTTFLEKEKALDHLSRINYRKGDSVDVFYNPEKIEDAVLIPGTYDYVYLAKFLGVIFVSMILPLGLGIIFILRKRSQFEKEKASDANPIRPDLNSGDSNSKDMEIYSVYRSSDLITAIKKYRELYGVSLVEAQIGVKKIIENNE